MPSPSTTPTNRPPPHPKPRPRPRPTLSSAPPKRLVSADARGFTLIEAALGSLIVGSLFVAALHTVAASRTTAASQAARGEAILLAQSLMEEVLAHPYTDPNQAPTFGRETGESGSNRAAFDDLDDFNGWTSSPPAAPDGTAVASARFRRSCEVKQVNPSNLSGSSSTDTGVRRVRVTVTHADRVLAELTAYRTPANPWGAP